MNPLDPVLGCRPSTVVRSLGADSRLALLGAGELLRAHEGPGALVTLPIPEAEEGTPVLEACFRAAREAAAAVGISRAPAERNRASPLFRECCAVAEAGRHRLPFFLQVGPFALGADKDARAAASRAILEHVEAGFTAFWLEPGALSEEDGARIAAEVVRPATELELMVEISGPEAPEAAALRVNALASAGLRGIFLRVASTAFGESPDLDRARAWTSAVAEAGACPSLALVGPLRARAISPWVEAGFRKVEPAAPLARARAGALGRASGEAADALRERLEAAAFFEALELCAATLSEGSGKRALAFLAEHGPR